jgi:hypothetical protein
MQQRSLSIKAKLAADYTVLNAWANVTGLSITAPEDGLYTIKSILNSWTNTNDDKHSLSLAINGNKYGAIARTQVTSGQGIISVTLLEDDVLLLAGDVVTVQAIYITGGGVIYYSAGYSEPYLQIIKRGV